MSIAYSGQLDCVRLLVDAGAKLNPVDSSFGDGNTALHKAILGGHEDVYAYLVDKGADINLANSDGITACQLFEQVKSEVGLRCLADESVVTFSASQSIANVDKVHETTTTTTPTLLCTYCNQPSVSFSRTKSKQLICTNCKDSNPSLLRNL